MLDARRLADSSVLVLREPFPLLVAHDQLQQSAQAALERDFPRYRSAGFFPYEEADCGPAVQSLVRQLVSPVFANALGARLGIENLGGYPTLVTLCHSLNKRHGTIHTDSRSKVATALVYLCRSWPEISGGCLRFLARSDDIDALVVPEIRPLYGTIAAFRRADNSYHGHLPYQGERAVVQVAWLISEAEKSRKTRRGRGARLVKQLTGRLDRWFGSNRDRNASHRD